MLQEIVMPQLGLTMTEGAVSAWLKKPGDRVERGEILFLVQTDKVEMEVESFVSGLLDNILIEPDVVVKVGTVIATVEDGRAAKSTAPAIHHVAAPPRETIPKTDVVSTKVVFKREIPISPRAKKLASSLGIDVALLTPSKGDRITEEDVRKFQEKTVAKPNRAVIAQRMTSSFHSAPAFLSHCSCGCHQSGESSRCQRRRDSRNAWRQSYIYRLLPSRIGSRAARTSRGQFILAIGSNSTVGYRRSFVSCTHAAWPVDTRYSSGRQIDACGDGDRTGCIGGESSRTEAGAQ